MEINKTEIYNDLIDSFMVYQHRLDCPMPTPTETKSIIEMKFRTDPLFQAKVKCLAGSVMHILDKHINP